MSSRRLFPWQLLVFLLGLATFARADDFPQTATIEITASTENSALFEPNTSTKQDTGGKEKQIDGKTKTDNKLFTGDDGRFDVSGFLDQTYGFLPVAIPITEPAVGYGLAAGLAFIDAPLGKASEMSRPDITIIGAMRTENGTEGAAVGDMRYWNGGQVQSLFGALSASVNLDFYGIGENDNLSKNPLRYTLEPQLGLVQVESKLVNSPTWLGLGYVYADIDVSFNAAEGTPSLPSYNSHSVVAGVLPSITYDTRDNVFTPTQGAYLELSGGWFGPALGGDDEFQRARLIGMHFKPLSADWFLALRVDGTASFKETPFYLRPFVNLRGVPVMRYQGDEVAQFEAELRWQLRHRYSVLAFAGVGKTWTDSESNIASQSDHNVINAGGLGFRYEIAHKYGIHMGLDIALSENDEAVYIQVGSAWARP